MDHTKNWIMHGLPCDEREWSLDGVAHQARQLQRNPSTGEVEEWIAPEQDTAVQMVEVTPNSTIRPEFIEAVEKALESAQRMGYKPGWVWYQTREMMPDLVELRWLAQKLGYKPGWALHKHAELEGRELPITNKAQVRAIKASSNIIPFPAPIPQPVEPDPSLDAIWTKVTALVKPSIAQTLFQKQGRLIKFSGTVAVVAIKSKQLMNLAEKRLDKIVEAFWKIYQAEVEVLLIVEPGATWPQSMNY